MIRGKQVNLRLVCEQDLDELYANLSDLELRGPSFPKTLSSQAGFKTNFHQTGSWSDSFGRFLIDDQQGKMIGSIYYFNTVIYSDALEIGYILFDEQARGKGMMTEALNLMSDYLFATKTLARLQLAISADNHASLAVAKKCGYVFEGTMKQCIFLNGEHRDLDLYAKTR